MTYKAEIRCMFCNKHIGYKEGFTLPNMISHGIGECCADWAAKYYGLGEI